MKAHGVPWLRRYLHGEIALAEAAEGGKRDTRRYTKRQMTWFRHQMPGWTAAAPQEALAVALRLFEAAVRRRPPGRGMRTKMPLDRCRGIHITQRNDAGGQEMRNFISSTEDRRRVTVGARAAGGG